MSAFGQGLQFGLMQGMFNNMFGFCGLGRFGGFWGNPFGCFNNFGFMGGGFFNYSPFNIFSAPMFGMPTFMNCSFNIFGSYSYPQTQFPATYNNLWEQSLLLSDSAQDDANVDTFVSTITTKSTTTTGSSAAASASKTSTAATTTKPAATGKKSIIPAKERVYDELIDKYGKKYDIDTDFIRAIIKQESSFNPNAKSSAGAMGLMQLMPETAKSYGVSDPYNPEQNIDAGVRMLKDLSKQFNGEKEMILAAYNWGSGNLTKYGYEKRPKETRNYIEKVMKYYNEYKNS